MDKAFYLAGGFYGDWKAQLHKRCKKLYVHDPEDGSSPHALYEFVEEDLMAIATADGVIAYWDAYPHLEGLMAEIGYAVARDIPVLLILDGVTVPNPFILGLARRVFIGLDAFIEWWNGRVEQGKPIV